MQTFCDYFKQQRTRKEVLNVAIAREVHESLRAWCESNGKFYFPPWDDLDEVQQNLSIEVVNTCLSRPDKMTPEAMHDLWMEVKRKDGWTYGPEFDDAAKTHPSMVPFDDLPEYEKVKDQFVIDVTEQYRERLA